MPTPRDLATAIERTPGTPARDDEWFQGYGVMGLPFACGHVLGLRRFPATALGTPYTSVWHRDPAGRWTFLADAPPQQSCPRFFDAGIDHSEQVDLDVTWTGPHDLTVTGPRLAWDVTLAATPVTRTMSALASRLPDRAWDDPRVLRMMAAVAGPALRVGHVGLQGTAPNGQHFQAHPHRMWLVADSRATVDGDDLGPPGPLDEQARLGDFWIPQRGVFAAGRSIFEAFDPDRHHEAAPAREP